MKNNIIKFSYNWNGKLENKAFTTIRVHNPKKYIVGRIYQIELNGTTKGSATLQAKRVLMLNQLNEFICYLDTGYNRTETISIFNKMYSRMDLNNIYFDLCLLVYNKSSTRKAKGSQTKLLL